LIIPAVEPMNHQASNPLSLTDATVSTRLSVREACIPGVASHEAMHTVSCARTPERLRSRDFGTGRQDRDGDGDPEVAGGLPLSGMLLERWNER
jgi:hypothetical protein